MSKIFTTEQAAQIVRALDTKINSTDTKAVNAAAAATAADTKATNAAAAAAAADTKATNAASAAATATTVANSKQRQLYRHTLHLGADNSGPWFDDLIIRNYIDENNRNLTNAEIVDIINNNKADIELVPVANDTSIPLSLKGEFTVSTNTISGRVYYYSQSNGVDEDSCSVSFTNFTQTVSAL